MTQRISRIAFTRIISRSYLLLMSTVVLITTVSWQRAYAASSATGTFIVQDGAFPWSDRINVWQLASTPQSLKGNGPLPQQICKSRNIVVPEGTKSIIVGVSNSDVKSFKASYPTSKETGDSISVTHADGTAAISYTIFKLDNPPSMLQVKSAGMLLLQLGDKSNLTSTGTVPPPVSQLKITKPTLVSFDTGEKSKLHIFLLMGQSNMVGRDTTGLESQTPDPHIGFLKGTDWFIAIEPMHKGGSGIGPGISFAREMLKNYPGGKIGLVPTAVGGSPLKDWVKGAPHYEYALKEAEIAAQFGVLEGILWHQGESDSEKQSDALTYEARLTQMFRDFRDDLGNPNLPIVVGQLGDFVIAPQVETVKTALKKIPTDLPSVEFADSKGLTDRGDHLHFSASSQLELGKRFEEAMQKLLSQTN